MYISLRHIAREIFRFFGLGLIKRSDLFSLRSAKVDYDNLRNKLRFCFEKILSNQEFYSKISIEEIVELSKSECGQDFFALIANDFASDKTFVEIGAYDGITYSNTYLLEKKFDWDGILIECIPRNFEIIKDSRKSKAILAAATPQNVESVDVVELAASNLSGLSQEVSRNKWKTISHKVRGYSLDSILKMADQNGKIGFLSIDIEGAEFSIFENVNLRNYEINAICVEHNFRPEAARLRELIASQGYREVFEEFSGNDFWFILEKN
jgi:FkbM family methyltransferase